VAVLFGEALLLMALLTVTPGTDTFLTLRQALVGGLRLAWPTIAGISTGTVVHATLAGAGLAILLAESPALFRVVQLAGVGYLAYLGIRSLRIALAKKDPTITADDARIGHGGWQGYRDGVAASLLNPKVALFYLAFLSPYISPGQNVLLTLVLYGLCHALMGELQLGTVALLADRLRTRITDPRFLRGADALLGLVLLGFAVRLALAHQG
jgi:threonine/homoserine/homoserine lactone efflux protein